MVPISLQTWCSTTLIMTVVQAILQDALRDIVTKRPTRVVWWEVEAI
jgi:hypothetical protein